jgi:hypothetical protein
MKKRTSTSKTRRVITPEERMAMIEEACYYLAEKRNFAPGYESEDWAKAEKEVDDLLDREA